jgi:type IV secretion system protein VirB4
MFALVRYLKSRSPDLGLALQVYAGSGTYGYIFDGDNAEALERKRWTMFDIRTILGMRNAALVPVLAHLLHRITRWFDGSPTMLLLDEIQEWLHHEQLERFVASVLDTRRKDNVRAMLCTPTPTHLARYKNLFGSVKAGCSTKIYGADSTAPTNTYAYMGLGATEKDIETISRLSIGNYLLKNDYGARVFALNPGPIAFAFTSMSGRDELALLAELHSRCSDADQVTDELLKAKGLQEAARTLGWKTRSGSEVAVAAE